MKKLLLLEVIAGVGALLYLVFVVFDIAHHHARYLPVDLIIGGALAALAVWAHRKRRPTLAHPRTPRPPH